jgi:hypothetical protein
MKSTNAAVSVIETTPAMGMRNAWDAYHTAIDTYQGALHNINRRFAEDFADDRFAVEVVRRYKKQDLLLEVARRLQSYLIQAAEKQFGARSTPLHIDERLVSEQFPLEREHYHSDDDDNTDVLVPFNPEGVWTWLEANYGGDKGKSESLRQAAERITKAFDFDRKAPVLKSGYLVFQLRVWIDDFEKKHNGVNKLSYNCQESVHQALQGMQDFARATGRDMLASGLATWKNLFHRNMRIVSREKHATGDRGSELQLITYLDRFEFRMRADTAEALQVFLGTHLAGPS